MLDEQTLIHLWKSHLREFRKRRALEFVKNKIDSLSIPLLKLFEKYIGVCESDGSEIITTKQIDHNSLQALIGENRTCAVHVPGFCPPNIAKHLSAQALTEYTNWKLGEGINTDMFYAGGSIPRQIAKRNWPDFRRYFLEREAFVYKQREMSNGAWPVDRLRLDLDDAWPYGTCLGHWLGHKSRPAIMRIMHEKNEPLVPAHGFIHTDDSPRLKPLKGTFSANIYLKTPKEGGKLYIWSINLSRITGIRSYLLTQILTMDPSYLFTLEWQQKIWKFLPKPHIIKPQTGDLVIIHSGRPHSVEPVKGGIRITNQLFIHASGRRPLTIRS